MNEKNPNNETKRTIGQVFSNTLQRFLLPNGVRLHPRHGDDTGGSEGVVGSYEEMGRLDDKTEVNAINSLSAKLDYRIPSIPSFPKHHPEEHQSTYLL